MPKQLGKYWISKVEGHCSTGCTVYGGYEDPSASPLTQDASFVDMGASMEPSHSVRRDSSSAPTARIKIYDRADVNLEALSANIKLQESLARRRFQLRQRYAHLYATKYGGDPAAVAAALLHRGSHGLSADTTDPLEATTSGGVELPNTKDLDDEVVPLLYLSAEHVLLLKDKMQSRSKVILIRDWMPDSMLQIISHGRLPEDGAFFYFFQLLQAVHFLHENRVVHRNIAAEHLHVTVDGAVLRLGGMSRAVHMQSDPVGATTTPEVPPPGSYGICSNCGGAVPVVAGGVGGGSRLVSSMASGGSSATNAGAAINTLMTTCPRCGVQQNRLQLLRTLTGSPGYLAPEVLAYRPPASSLMSSQLPTSSPASSTPPFGSGQSAGREPRSEFADAQARDVWSCGVLLFFMLTATLPFDPVGQAAGAQADFRRTPEQIDDTCARIVACRYVIPSYVSEPAQQLLHSLLQREPSQRPTALEAMAYPCLAQARATLTSGM